MSNSNRICAVSRSDVCSNLVECIGVDYCNAGCNNYYRCKNGSCVPTSSICNGILHDGCDEDTEWTTGPGFKCSREGNTCFLPQQLVVDGIQDCDQADDLCFVIDSEHVGKRLVKNFYYNNYSRALVYDRS